MLVAGPVAGRAARIARRTKLGDGDAEGLGFGFGKVVVLGVEADLRADHVITCWLYENKLGAPCEGDLE